MVDLTIKSGADAIKKIKRPKNKKKFIFGKGESARKFINALNKKSA